MTVVDKCGVAVCGKIKRAENEAYDHSAGNRFSVDTMTHGWERKIVHCSADRCTICNVRNTIGDEIHDSVLYESLKQWFSTFFMQRPILQPNLT